MRATICANALLAVGITVIATQSTGVAQPGKGGGKGPTPQPARPQPPVQPRPAPSFQRPIAVPSYRPTNPAQPRPAPQVPRPAPVPSVRPNAISPKPIPNRPQGMFNPSVRPPTPTTVPPQRPVPRPTPTPLPPEQTTTNRFPNPGSTNQQPWFQMPLNRNWPQSRGNFVDNRWQQWRHDGNWNDLTRRHGDVVRNNFNSYYLSNRYGRLYTPDWYRNTWQHGYFWRYPTNNQWFWWTFATAPLLNNWLAWNVATPLYYNYGDNFTYDNGLVYYNQQPLGQYDVYINQATQLAQSGAQELASAANVEWLPMGVFALTQNDQADPTMFMQLALTKSGLVGGTYRNTITNEALTVSGRVDPKTQRAAWILGDNTSLTMEAGIYNLTQNQTPVLLHWGAEQTQTWLLTRIPAPQQ